MGGGRVGKEAGGPDKGELLRNKIEFLDSFQTPIELFCIKICRPRKKVLQAFAQQLKLSLRL